MIWLILALGPLLFWVVFAILMGRGMAKMRALESVEPLSDVPVQTQGDPANGDVAPVSLTVVVPARNEGAEVRAALRSLLDQTLPDLEIILVNDRSEDDTGAVAEALAAEYPGRLRVVHITELPEGWLGKCNALQTGAADARGEYVLFTDGDVVFEPTALARALAHVRREKADFLCVLPEMITKSSLEQAFVVVFGQFFLMKFSPWRAMERRSAAFIGVGAFNMIRRTFYTKLGGHRFLRMQVLDDVMLGKLSKASGAAVRVLMGRNMVRVRWQDGVLGYVRGVEKNAFAAMGYSVARSLAATIVMGYLTLWPWLGTLFGDTASRLVCAATAIVVLPVIGLAAAKMLGRGLLGALFVPVGGVLIVAAMMRSMIVAVRRGGILWRGTLYPLSELRKFRL